MEKKYEPPQMTSNFGQNYMKQQTIVAQERKNNKMVNQNKKDAKEETNVAQIQKQL